MQVNVKIVLENSWVTPFNLLGIVDQALGQLGAVNGGVWLLGEEGNRAVKVVLHISMLVLAVATYLAERLDGVNSTGTTADNDDPLLLGLSPRLACLGNDTANLGSDLLAVGGHDNLAVLYFCIVLVERVKTRSVLNVASADVETGSDGVSSHERQESRVHHHDH